MTRRRNILFLISIGLLALFGKANAQTDTTKNDVFGFFIIIPAEFPVIDTKDFTQQLTSNGYPNVNYPKTTPGIGLQFYTNRLIGTFSFNKRTKKNENDLNLTEVEYRSTSFNVGYSITKSPLFSVYPYIGFKGSGLNYLYKEKVPDSTSFGNYLQTNYKYTEVTNSRAHLDLGIGISHQWFYIINLRFGYLLPLEVVRWKVDNSQTTLTNSPTIRYQYYFSLTLGLGNIITDDYINRYYTEP